MWQLFQQHASLCQPAACSAQGLVQAVQHLWCSPALCERKRLACAAKHRVGCDLGLCVAGSDERHQRKQATCRQAVAEVGCGQGLAEREARPELHTLNQSAVLWHNILQAIV